MTDSYPTDISTARAELAFWRTFIADTRATLDAQALARCEAAAELAEERLRFAVALDKGGTGSAPVLGTADSN